MSRAVRSPRRPLGQPVISGSVLVGGGRGGRGGASGVVRVLGRTRRTGVTVIAVVSATSVPLVVGTAVIPRTPRVVPLSLEGAPVALENLRIGGKKSRFKRATKSFTPPE